MIFTIALVGRANVGKTTIFNRIVDKKQKAIVKDYAGTTRDRNEVETDYFNLKVKFVDAAGIEYQNAKGKIERQMLNQALKSIDNADLCLFVVDGKFGLTSTDDDIFNILRKKGKNTILIVNKTENPSNLAITNDELNKFNISKHRILISAEHNFGFGDLYNAIKDEYENWETKNKDMIKEQENQTIENQDHNIRIAILGRPNAGKSTFLNNLLQEDRLITSDIAGTTRDKIEIKFSYKNQDFILIDTAGIRKKYKNGEDLEYSSVEKSLEALQYADIAIVIMDITVALEEQDLSICQKVCNEGRILVVCFNKWDLVPKGKDLELVEKLKKIIQKSVAQVKGIVFFTCSAIKDQNLTIMLDEMQKLYNKWNTKIGAGKMNKKIEEAKLTMNVINELKIRYINQIKTRPPTFIAFSGKNEKDITTQKVDAIKNWLYREFDFTGIPIRISVRGKSKNKNQ